MFPCHIANQYTCVAGMIMISPELQQQTVPSLFSLLPYSIIKLFRNLLLRDHSLASLVAIPSSIFIHELALATYNEAPLNSLLLSSQTFSISSTILSLFSSLLENLLKLLGIRISSVQMTNLSSLPRRTFSAF